MGAARLTGFFVGARLQFSTSRAQPAREIGASGPEIKCPMSSFASCRHSWRSDYATSEPGADPRAHMRFRAGTVVDGDLSTDAARLRAAG